MRGGYSLNKLFYGPILYFQMKSYIKEAIWLFFILVALQTNVIVALLLWIIAGWLGKRKLVKNQIYKPTPKEAQTPSSKIESQDIEIPKLQEVPEGPEYSIAGFIDVETTGLDEKRDQIIEFAISLFY